MPYRFPRLACLALAALLIAGTTPLVAPFDVHARDRQAYQGRLIVIWREAPDEQLEGVATRSVSKHGRRSVVTAEGQDLALVAARLRRDPRVKAVLPDVRMTVLGWPQTPPSDPHYAGSQDDLGLIGVPTAWLSTTGDPDVTVAVLDTGLDIGHPDLAGLRVVAPRNEITNTSDVTDGHGHGTHVTGTIAATTDNGLGVAGIAPGVSVIPVKVLADSGSGSFSDIMDGMDWARTHGADIISMSLGGTMDASSAAYFQQFIDDEHAAGITIIAAAGNSGNGTLSYPASFAHVISVAATDNTGSRASFSQYNWAVDVAAPGVGTMSTLPGGAYAAWNGTSMATPHVAAVAALVRSAHPGWSASQVEAAVVLGTTDRGPAGRDDQYGHGLVNAVAALGWGGDPMPEPTPNPTPAPTPVPTPVPVVNPKVTALAASPTSIYYDANGYCPTAAKTTTVKATLANAALGIAAPSRVELFYVRPDTTIAKVAMVRGTIGSTSTPWTGTVSTLADGTLRGGSVSYWVVATSTSGGTSRYPAGSATSTLVVRACPNVPPSVTSPTASTSRALTNPLGTGMPPAGLPAAITFWATATDTDGVATASLVLTGAGLTAPLTIPMARSGNTWSTTVDPTARRIPGGTLTWKVSATDVLGREALATGSSITLVRADTAGAVAYAGSSSTPSSQVVLVTASDPDATVGTTSNLQVKVAWTARYVNRATGVMTTTAAATATAVFVSGTTYRATISTPWLTTATSNAQITVTPSAIDPYKGTTAGAPVTHGLVASGAPTIASPVASATRFATDPLGTGISAGLPTTVSFAARVYDTDAVASVTLVYSGAGLASAATLPMSVGSDGFTWTALLDASSAGLTASGTLAWKVVATDVAGLAATATGKSIAVVREDTPGTAAVTGVGHDASGNVVLTITATDPDAVIGTTTSLKVQLAWSATVGATTYRATTTTAQYRGGGTWTATLPVASALNVSRSGTFTWKPVATDPYGYVTNGSSTVQVVPARG